MLARWVRLLGHDEHRSARPHHEIAGVEAPSRVGQELGRHRAGDDRFRGAAEPGQMPPPGRREGAPLLESGSRGLRSPPEGGVGRIQRFLREGPVGPDDLGGIDPSKLGGGCGSQAAAPITTASNRSASWRAAASLPSLDWLRLPCAAPRATSAILPADIAEVRPAHRHRLSQWAGRRACKCGSAPLHAPALDLWQRLA